MQIKFLKFSKRNRKLYTISFSFYSTVVFDRLRKNQSRLHRKPLLSNGYDSEDENADNSTSEETEEFLNETAQLTQRATSNRYIRIERQKEIPNVPIGFRSSTVNGRNRIIGTEQECSVLFLFKFNFFYL